MPLKGHQSICRPKEATIVSKDRKSAVKHIAHNREASDVSHYRIDGEVIKEGSRCDYLLLNETKKDAYFIELKGSDISHALEQLDETAKKLSSELAGYTLYFRIVANRINTQAIRDTKYHRYQKKWQGRLQKKTTCKEEDI